MVKKQRKQPGFTIVELLIVIVVIGVLAAITIVAYNGIQQRARDTRRSSDLSSMQKALELYHADKSGYPVCGGTGAYVVGGALSSGTLSSCIGDELVPAYISSIPVDPMNSGSYVYRYAVGYRKTGSTTFTGPQTDNYIIGVKQETVSSPVYSAWGYSDLTLLLGSTN